METLHGRLSVSLGPFNTFLKIIGIYIDDPFSCSYKWTCWLINLWSLFWLLLNFLINLQTFIQDSNGRLENLLVKSYELSASTLTEEFNLLFIRLSNLIFYVCIHFLVVTSIRSIFRDFIDALILLDNRLNRPDFPSIRKLSTYSVAWILFIVRIIFLCNLKLLI